MAPEETPRIGLAFTEQVLESLPVDQDDVPMHFVVTESDTFAAPAAPATVVGARSK
jgi:5-formyltetrahydrofolate cyclo-ligase